MPLKPNLIHCRCHHCYQQHTLHVDFCDPFPTGEYLLVVIDSYSQFPEVDIVHSIAVSKLECILLHIVYLSSYGVIMALLSQAVSLSKAPENYIIMAPGKFRSWNFCEAVDENHSCSENWKERLEKRAVHFPSKLWSYSSFYNGISTIRTI